jgi:aminoglycoside 3-N-acetyltransferase
MPAFDPALTPTRDMGRVVETFRHHPHTMRSNHPTQSHLANGPAAVEITAHHPLADGFGPASPLGRLYDLDATVVLLGVGHANNTSLHLAEQLVAGDRVTRTRQGTAMLVDGVRQWIEYDDADVDDSDFGAVGAAFAVTGLERTGTVGRAPTRVMPMRAVVDFAVEWFPANRPAVH